MQHLKHKMVPERSAGEAEPGKRLPRLLTADEVADVLRTSRKAIYAMNDRGQLPGATRIGRRLLFRVDDLLRWLDERRAPSLEDSRR